MLHTASWNYTYNFLLAKILKNQKIIFFVEVCGNWKELKSSNEKCIKFHEASIRLTKIA